MARSVFGLASAGLLLCGLLFCLPAASIAAEPPKLMPVAYTVACDDPAVGKKLESRIAELFRAQPGYVVRERYPSAKLIVYAGRDVNSRIDSNGYIIAIAHVQYLEAVYLAQKLLLENPTKDEGVKAAVSALINDQGTISYLNVAHLDDASDAKIDIVARSIVSTFFAKTPARPGR